MLDIFIKAFHTLHICEKGQNADIHPLLSVPTSHIMVPDHNLIHDHDDDPHHHHHHLGQQYHHHHHHLHLKLWWWCGTVGSGDYSGWADRNMASRKYVASNGKILATQRGWDNVVNKHIYLSRNAWSSCLRRKESSPNSRQALPMDFTQPSELSFYAFRDDHADAGNAEWCRYMRNFANIYMCKYLQIFAHGHPWFKYIWCFYVIINTLHSSSKKHSALVYQTCQGYSFFWAFWPPTILVRTTFLSPQRQLKK